MAKVSKILLLNSRGRGKVAVRSSASGKRNRLGWDEQPREVHVVTLAHRGGGAEVHPRSDMKG